MKKRKSIVLSNDKAKEILKELLNVFCQYSNTGKLYRLSYPIELDEEANKEIKEQKSYTILEWENNVLRVKKYKIEKEDDAFLNNTYVILYNKQKYRMNIFDSPQCCGYNSLLKDYNEDTYHFVQVQKLNDLEEAKYEICFGFDIITMKFLELFEVDYINSKRIRRECESIDQIEEEFRGKKLIS